MKIRALISSVLLAFSINVMAFQNEPTGFRGIKWGEDFAVHAGEMTFLRGNEESTKWYLRKDDKMFLGDAQLSEITYGYVAGRLLIVTIFTSGAENRKALTSVLLSQFGKPDEHSYGDYTWGSDMIDETVPGKKKKTDTQIRLSCGYKIHPTPGAEDDCSVQFVSNKVMKELWRKKWKRHEESVARAHGGACPTATKVKAESKERYTEVIEANDFGPRSFGWIFSDRQGWAIFRDTKYDNDYLANRAGFLAVKKATIRKTLVKGDRLSTLAPYFGKIGEPAWAEDQYGRPILVERYEAIYPKGCN